MRFPNAAVPLLGPREKAELETLILEHLTKHYEQNGPQALLVPGLHLGVSAGGVRLAPSALELAGALACVEIRTLFTALCYIAANDGQGVPREALDSLATEATSAAAAQINRIVPD
jgi:hypothetical protein